MGQSNSAPSNQRQPSMNKKKSTKNRRSLTKKKSTNKKNGTNRNGLHNISENAETDINGIGFRMNKKLTVNDFEFLKVVGKGSFGKVMMVRKRDDQQIYAMKVLKKK
eukprot:26081_1